MNCRKCGIKMTHHLCFSKQKNVEYYKCPKCGYESTPIPYFFTDKSKTIKVPKGKRR